MENILQSVKLPDDSIYYLQDTTQNLIDSDAFSIYTHDSSFELLNGEKLEFVYLYGALELLQAESTVCINVTLPEPLVLEDKLFIKVWVSEELFTTYKSYQKYINVGSGAIPIYYSGTNILSDQYDCGNVLQIVYRNNITVDNETISGWWYAGLTTIPTVNPLPKLTGIYSVIGTQSSDTDNLTGQIDASELFEGMTIAYFLSAATIGSNVTLELTLSDDTTTAPVAVYFGAEKMKQQINAGSVVYMTYYPAGTAGVYGGTYEDDRWVVENTGFAVSDILLAEDGEPLLAEDGEPLLTEGTYDLQTELKYLQQEIDELTARLTALRQSALLKIEEVQQNE